MIVVTHIVLADTSTPTPQTAGCDNGGPLKVAPHCPDSDTVPVLLTSLSCPPGLYS